MTGEQGDYNSIEHLDRAKVEPYTDTKALDFDDVAAMFDRFDLSKPEDLGDYALLEITLQTGHRVQTYVIPKEKTILISSATSLF